MNSRLLFTCLALCLSHTVSSAPLDTSDKPGEEQVHRANSKSINLEDKVKEAVQRAEVDASLAAEDAVRHGHKAESRVTSNKGSSEYAEGSTDHVTEDQKPSLHVRTHAPLGRDDEEGNRMKRVKEHKVNRKPSGRMLNLGDLGGSNNDYKEDTRLEDRLAMEAEEEKKYETGEGYGTGGGGGGNGWDDGGKGVNWATNIQRQDAAEKQSIQAQVASESAHELDEIQRAIAAESQSSRGSASIGNGGASVMGGAASPVQEQGGMQPRITNPEGGEREGQPMAFIGGQQKSISPSENQDEFQAFTSPYLSDQSSIGAWHGQPEISNFIHQADKMSPSEMRRVAQGSMGIESLGARETQGLSGGIGGLGGLEGVQQLGGQSQGTSLEQASMTGSDRFEGAMEAGGMSPGTLGQAGLGETGLSETAVSRMTDGSLGGRAGESPQGIPGMQSIQDVQGMQGMQGMQSMSSALTGGQSQGGILSDGGGMSALQGQGMVGASLQGGLQSIMGGGGLAGLQTMGAGADLGQQQMAFKKRSKTHQRDETKRKNKKRINKNASRKSSLPKKHLLEDNKTSSIKKSKLTKRYHSKQTKTV